jgi:ribosomal protein S18 acetylase RimI-like enzyme
MGCKEVKLVTRVNNLWAQRIYDRYGFVQYKRDDKFVDYVLKKP